MKKYCVYNYLNYIRALTRWNSHSKPGVPELVTAHAQPGIDSIAGQPEQVPAHTKGTNPEMANKPVNDVEHDTQVTP